MVALLLLAKQTAAISSEGRLFMFTINQTLVEICTEPLLQKYLPYLVWNHDLLGKSGHKPLCKLWNADAAQAVAETLEQLCENERKGNCLYPVYPAEAAGKQAVCIVDFPCAHGREKPWILLCAGGSYSNVWNMTEAWVSAAHLNRLGYHVFALNYTVGRQGLMPEPIKDVAAAVSYIRQHATDFDIQPDAYAIGGFSAGGHLAAAWAAEEYGYAAYKAVKPMAVLLLYAAFSSDYVQEEHRDFYRSNIAGKDAGPETVAYWNVENVVTADFPPAYLIHSEDDPLVGVQTTRVMDERLTALGVPHVAEYVQHSGHGFCDGAGTDAAGWPERADAFLQQLMR